MYSDEVTDHSPRFFPVKTPKPVKHVEPHTLCRAGRARPWLVTYAGARKNKQRCEHDSEKPQSFSAGAPALPTQGTPKCPAVSREATWVGKDSDYPGTTSRSYKMQKLKICYTSSVYYSILMIRRFFVGFLEKVYDHAMVSMSFCPPGTGQQHLMLSRGRCCEARRHKPKGTWVLLAMVAPSSLWCLYPSPLIGVRPPPVSHKLSSSTAASKS